jgi:CheY-like chemotaxis protein
MKCHNPSAPGFLLVDDDLQVLDAVRRQLRRHFDVTATYNPKEAIRLAVSSGLYAVVVSDLRMPGMEGVSLLYLIRQTAPDTLRVFIDG